MKQRERLFFIYMIFSLRSFEKSIRSPSKYVCNICERVQSGKEKNYTWAATCRVTEHVASLEATAGTSRSSTFHLQRRIETEQEEEEDVNIKFLLSCSTRHSYVFSSCSITVEQPMSNTEIVNKRGIPQGLLYLEDKFNEPFWIRF
jgi:hypothetical protein